MKMRPGQGPGNQMQSSQMERTSSQMEMGGPRSGSPNNGDAPSPKRARLDGSMPQMPQARPGQQGQMQGGSQVGPLPYFTLFRKPACIILRGALSHPRPHPHFT